jgi:drug/metabolite transporter (DMT)-like permease
MGCVLHFWWLFFERPTLFVVYNHDHLETNLHHLLRMSYLLVAAGGIGYCMYAGFAKALEWLPAEKYGEVPSNEMFAAVAASVLAPILVVALARMAFRMKKLEDDCSQLREQLRRALLGKLSGE